MSDHETLKKQKGSRAWIGVDLDGTLAKHDMHGDGTWDGREIGPPVPAMVARVKEWLAAGRNVRICTARVSSLHPEAEREDTRVRIEAWCERHLGVALPVTAEKDYFMVELWDDRAVGVLRDTGTEMTDLAYAGGYDQGRLDALTAAEDEDDWGRLGSQ